MNSEMEEIQNTANAILENSKNPDPLKYVGSFAGSKVPFFFNLNNKTFSADGEYLSQQFKLVGNLEFDQQNYVRCITRYNYNINTKRWEENTYKSLYIDLTQNEFKFNHFNCVKLD